MAMHEHQERVTAALRAINAVYEDESVPQERVMRSLTKLAAEVVICQDALVEIVADAA